MISARVRISVFFMFGLFMAITSSYAKPLPGNVRGVVVKDGATVVVNVSKGRPTIIDHDSPFSAKNDFRNEARVENKGNKLIVYPFVDKMDVEIPVIVATKKGNITYFLAFHSVNGSERYDNMLRIISGSRKTVNLSSANESHVPAAIDPVDIIKMARNDYYPRYTKFINARVGEYLPGFDALPRKYRIAREAIIGPYKLVVLAVENKTKYQMPMNVTQIDISGLEAIQAFPNTLSPAPSNEAESHLPFRGRSYLYMVFR